MNPAFIRINAVHILLPYLKYTQFIALPCLHDACIDHTHGNTSGAKIQLNVDLSDMFISLTL